MKAYEDFPEKLKNIYGRDVYVILLLLSQTRIIFAVHRVPSGKFY